jgi:hypothetical protein
MPRMKAALLCLALLAAQATAPEVEITAEPHHHFTFENKSVRVFNVEVAPNTETLTHWHRHDYFSITLGAIEITNAVKDKPPVTAKLPDGDVRFVPATFAHFVRDLSDHPFRNVTIEILEDESLRNSTAKWDPDKNEDRGLDILTNGTKQILRKRRHPRHRIRTPARRRRPYATQGGIIPLGSRHRSQPARRQRS